MSLLASVLDTLSTFPLDIPDPDPVAPPGFEGPVGTILSWLKWGGLALAVGGLMIVGGMMAINQRRGEAAGELGLLGKILIGVIIIGAAASIVGFLSGV